MATPTDRIVLLLCHGSSYHKGTWAPIVRRIKASGLLQRVPCDILPIDLRYHGLKSSDADAATLYYEDGDENEPRVEHPAKRWAEWAPNDLLKITNLLHNEDIALGRKTHVVGVGHSLGAAALLKCEVQHPGTFAGLVLFEPTFTYDRKIEGTKWGASLIVKHTLAGTEQWNTKRAFRRWHLEAVEGFLDGGVKKTRDGKFRLALPLLQEAAFYCIEIISYTEKQMRDVTCRVVFEHGAETFLFNVDDAQRLADAIPDMFTLSPALEGVSHLTVLEDPSLCAARIVVALESFPIVQRVATSASKL